ncbi:hypothetical protein GTO91_07355 [Heliobacterium undosum]|uniref:Uncharacterized protein n=1 Tax=Heliomicrobium undosum TaxID=121734 RepID=A0A845KZJ4_9FIRM|nr:hypothetical protein [Heliomicrobium undosum]MZP29522.1 hypothetical protein [Heliomicrobium undosum]
MDMIQGKRRWLMMAGIMVILPALLYGCGKPAATSGKELGVVSIPVQEDKLAIVNSYEISPFEVSVGSSNRETKETPFEIRNVSPDAVKNLVISVRSQDGSAVLKSKDGSVAVGSDSVSANIGLLAPKSGRVLYVEKVLKDQFELYVTYGDNQQMRIFPKN